MLTSFYRVLHKYQIGEIITIETGVGPVERKAKVLSYGTTTEYGEEEETVEVQYLDDFSKEVYDLHTLNCCANLPIASMMQIAEGVVQVWMRASRILPDENEREHVIKTVATMDRMIGEAAADNLELLGLPSDGLCVVLDEEYGYKRHIWMPGMTLTEFTEWWENLESVKKFFFSPANTLPGKVVTLDTAEHLSIWRALDSCGMVTTAHIHTDGDSFMTTPDGVTHHHKGYDMQYYDSRPGDTCCMTLGDGTQVMGRLDDNLEFEPNVCCDCVRKEIPDTCCGCPHQEGREQEHKDEDQVGVSDLPDDSGEGKRR